MKHQEQPIKDKKRRRMSAQRDLVRLGEARAEGRQAQATPIIKPSSPEHIVEIEVRPPKPKRRRKKRA